MSTIIIIILLLIGLISSISQKKDLEYQEKAELTSGELRVKYPNFVRAIRSMYGNEAHLTLDNNKALNYIVAVKSLSSHVGNMVLCLHDSINDSKPYIIQLYRGFDNVEIITPKIYLDKAEDIDVTAYIDKLNSLAAKILFDKEYRASAHPFL